MGCHLIFNFLYLQTMNKLRLYKLDHGLTQIEVAGTIDSFQAMLAQTPNVTEKKLLDVLAEMNTLSTSLKIAYKRDCVLNLTKAANAERNDAISLVLHLARGFARYPKQSGAAIREAGTLIYGIIRKYRGIRHLSYDGQAAAMESLYTEFAQPEAQAAITLLGDKMTDAVALIDSTDKAFVKARVDYHILYLQRGEPATQYKLRLLDLCNSTFLSMLQGFVNVDQATYGEFAELVKKRVRIANVTVRLRRARRKAEANGEPLPEPTDPRKPGDDVTGGSDVSDPSDHQADGPTQTPGTEPGTDPTHNQGSDADDESKPMI